MKMLLAKKTGKSDFLFILGIMHAKEDFKMYDIYFKYGIYLERCSNVCNVQFVEPVQFLFDLILCVPVNSLSVMLGQVFSFKMNASGRAAVVLTRRRGPDFVMKMQYYHNQHHRPVTVLLIFWDWQ